MVWIVIFLLNIRGIKKIILTNQQQSYVSHHTGQILTDTRTFLLCPVSSRLAHNCLMLCPSQYTTKYVLLFQTKLQLNSEEQVYIYMLNARRMHAGDNSRSLMKSIWWCLLSTDSEMIWFSRIPMHFRQCMKCIVPEMKPYIWHLKEEEKKHEQKERINKQHNAFWCNRLAGKDKMMNALIFFSLFCGGFYYSFHFFFASRTCSSSSFNSFTINIRRTANH